MARFDFRFSERLPSGRRLCAGMELGRSFQFVSLRRLCCGQEEGSNEEGRQESREETRQESREEGGRERQRSRLLRLKDGGVRDICCLGCAAGPPSKRPVAAAFGLRKTAAFDCAAQTFAVNFALLRRERSARHG